MRLRFWRRRKPAEEDTEATIAVSEEVRTELRSELRRLNGLVSVIERRLLADPKAHPHGG